MEVLAAKSDLFNSGSMSSGGFPTARHDSTYTSTPRTIMKTICRNILKHPRHDYVSMHQVFTTRSLLNNGLILLPCHPPSFLSLLHSRKPISKGTFVQYRQLEKYELYLWAQLR